MELCVIRTYSIKTTGIENDRFTIIPSYCKDVNCASPESSAIVELNDEYIEFDYFDSIEQQAALKEYVELLRKFGSKCLC